MTGPLWAEVRDPEWPARRHEAHEWTVRQALQAAILEGVWAAEEARRAGLLPMTAYTRGLEQAFRRFAKRYALFEPDFSRIMAAAKEEVRQGVHGV